MNDTIHFIILNSYYKTPKPQSLAENLIITLDEQMQQYHITHVISDLGRWPFVK